MNDHIHSEGSLEEHDHGELGDAEYAEFMELAAEEGFDLGGLESLEKSAANLDNGLIVGP